MRKVLTFLGVSLMLAWVVPAVAQAPDMFADVPTDHWAYPAVEALRAKNIVIGYPDQQFKGGRTLTRYQFAVALDRALKQLAMTPGPAGRDGGPGATGATGGTGGRGEPGAAGAAGPPGVRPEELATFRRLLNEFKDELASMGNRMGPILRRVDQVAKDVADLKSAFDKAPKWSGGIFFAGRGDETDGEYFDKDGRETPFGPGILNTAAMVHELVLGVSGNLGEGASYDARLVTGNYRPYLGNSLAVIEELDTTPESETYLDKLAIKAPLGAFTNGGITLGRFSHKVSRLTLWRPDVDTYFYNPFLDDGGYRMDGGVIDAKFGSVTTQFFGGQTRSVRQTDGSAINSPYAGIGTGIGSGSLFAGGMKPHGQPYQGQMMVDQLAGVTLGLALRPMLGSEGGHVGFTAINTENKGFSMSGAGFENVMVLGADLDLKFSDRLSFRGDWGKTNTGNSLTSTVNAHENNAFIANLGWESAGFEVNAGYKYIDPLFYAPGYWARIGNWLNPTNIQGPTFRASKDFSPAFGVNVGGDFYTAARNRGPGGLSENDCIQRTLVGVRWDVAKGFRTTVDWEGVYYTLDNTRFSGTGKVHPTEQYLRIGTGYSLTTSTILKFMYEIGDFNGHGALNGGSSGLNRYSYNTFTGSVAVKF